MTKRRIAFALAAVFILALAFSGCAPTGTARGNDRYGAENVGYNDRMGNNRTGTTGYNNNTIGGRNGYGNNDLGGVTGFDNTGMGGINDYGRTGYGNRGMTGTNGYDGTNYGGVGTDYLNYGGNNATNDRLRGGLGTPLTQADNIARAVERLPGVQNATVVVSGNTAYVGIDTGGTRLGAANDNVGNIKQRVAQTCRNADNTVNTVYVSADANFMDRLRRVGDGMRQGRPVEGFRTELTELVRRMTPERQ